MKLTFAKDQIAYLSERGFTHQALSASRWRDDTVVDITAFSEQQIEKLTEVLKEDSRANNGLLQKLSLWQKAVSNPEQTVSRLDVLESVLRTFFARLPNHWVFPVDGRAPLVFTGAVYSPADRQKDAPACVQLSLAHWEAGKIERNVRTVYSSDLPTSVPKLLMKYGFQCETEELVADYRSLMEDYADKIQAINGQFLYRTTVLPKPADSGWRGEETITGSEAVYRIVNDHSILKKQDEQVLRINPSHLMFSEEDEELGLTSNTIPLPIHPRMYAFNLETHDYYWVETWKTEPYQYDHGLVNHLIIDQEYKDLIKILTEKPDVLRPDFVSNKSGGTIILACGPPGVGKSMSAEAFAEGTDRILYKIQSDQLGVSPDDIENNLTACFDRAIRWNAVLLLDEADIYVRTRGTDIKQNAIVGTMLRTIEYFNGTMFMTTNLGHDVDDAIISRASAVIVYKMPSKEQAITIFNQFACLFGLSIASGVAEAFCSTDDRSGRTIKNILRLAARLGHTNPSLQDLVNVSKYVFNNRAKMLSASTVLPAEAD